MKNDYLLAINKPAEWSCIRETATAAGPWSMPALSYHRFRTGPPIRAAGHSPPPDKDNIRRDPRGQTDTVHGALARMFFEHTIEKYYVALCAGLRPAEHAIIDMPLGRNRRDPNKTLRSNRWKKRQNGILAPAPCVRCFGGGHSSAYGQDPSDQGAFQQPRVSNPVRSAVWRGNDRVETLAVLDRPKAYKIYKCFDRHALHARKISFVHPVTREPMALVAPFPEDFLAAFEMLGFDPNC